MDDAEREGRGRGRAPLGILEADAVGRRGALFNFLRLYRSASGREEEGERREISAAAAEEG